MGGPAAQEVESRRASPGVWPSLTSPPLPPSQEQTPLFLAAREGAAEVAQLLLALGAARALRDQAGLAPADVARQRHHWDLLALLEGAGPAHARHKAPPGPAGAFARARAASGSGRRGGAVRRNRTLSVGAAPRGRGAGLQTRTLSVDLAAHGAGAHSQYRSLAKGAGGGPPRRDPTFPAGTRGPRPGPAARPGRSGVATSAGGPRDWVSLGACGPAPNTRSPPPCLTPSPERGSPGVAWGSPVHQVIPSNAVSEPQK